MVSQKITPCQLVVLLILPCSGEPVRSGGPLKAQPLNNLRVADPPLVKRAWVKEPGSSRRHLVWSLTPEGINLREVLTSAGWQLPEAVRAELERQTND